MPQGPAPLRWPALAASSTDSSMRRFRSATDIEKYSACLPAMNKPPRPSAVIQCRRFSRMACSSNLSDASNVLRLAAHTPCMCSRAYSLA